MYIWLGASLKDQFLSIWIRLSLLDTNSRIISKFNQIIERSNTQKNNQTTETITVKCIVNKYSSCMVQLLKKIKWSVLGWQEITLADISGIGMRWQTAT